MLRRNRCLSSTTCKWIPDINRQFAQYPIRLGRGKVAEKAQNHRATLLESDITRGEVLGITADDRKYCTLGYNLRDVDLIDEHLGDTIETACEKDEILVTSEKVKIVVDKK